MGPGTGNGASRLSLVASRVVDSARFRARRLVRWLVVGPTLALLRRRRRMLHDGVTVITVSWNTLAYLKVMVSAVQRRSPGVPIIVVDNASSDGTRAWARRQPGVRLISLPANVHHGPAMDLAIHLCRTTHFVALDVDAFPVSDDWLTRPLADLASGAAVAGGLGNVGRADFVHACYLAMETERFIAARHTFDAGPTWDTAERIAQREQPIATYAATSVRGPGCVGTVFGDLVYHNFYSSRLQAPGRSVIDGVERGDPEAAWAEALERFQVVAT